MEFERHTAGGSNMHYFDFLVRLKTEQEHLFRNIQRNEYHNLFQFVQSVPLAPYLLIFHTNLIRKLAIALFLIYMLFQGERFEDYEFQCWKCPEC